MQTITVKDSLNTIGQNNGLPRMEPRLPSQLQVNPSLPQWNRNGTFSQSTLQAEIASIENRNAPVHPGKSLLEALSKSKIYDDYERAFNEATGLPLTLRPVESWQLPLHQKRCENRFCALMARKSRTCAECLQVQQKLSETATQQAQTVHCAFGLSDTAVPVRMGEQLLGFLQTGQVFTKKPSETQFNRVARQLVDWGLETSQDELKQAYFATPVFAPKQYESVVKLLNIFAQHLAMISNQVLVQQQTIEPAVILKAKEFIRENQSEDISLGDVAKAVNTSTFYFCKMFKKVTGLNFTEYLSRLRVERAKNLLLNRNLRISEIAYEVGFQSLTHFNRVFKRFSGQAPTEYRTQLPSTDFKGNARSRPIVA